jgi:hypothetical protein
MKRILFAILLMTVFLAITIFSACETRSNISTDSNNSVNKIESDSQSISPDLTKVNTAQFVDTDVILKISTNKDTYIPGEIIQVDASAENRSPDTVKYGLACQGDPTPYVNLENNAYFSGFPLEEKELGGVRTVVPMFSSGQLKPHEIVKRKVVWDQKILLQNQQAPQGTYNIICWMSLGNYQNESLQKHISVNLNINIVDAPKWITPEQAKNIVLGLPEVKNWQETHSGKNVVKQENGNYYIFMMGEWQKVAPQFIGNEQKTPLTIENYKEWMPDVNITLEKGIWIITMGTKMGPNPHFVTINVDPVTGDVLDLKFYG